MVDQKRNNPLATFSLTKYDTETLNLISEKSRLPKSAIVRLALEHFIKCEDGLVLTLATLRTDDKKVMNEWIRKNLLDGQEQE